MNRANTQAQKAMAKACAVQVAVVTRLRASSLVVSLTKSRKVLACMAMARPKQQNKNTHSSVAVVSPACISPKRWERREGDAADQCAQQQVWRTPETQDRIPLRQLADHRL